MKSRRLGALLLWVAGLCWAFHAAGVRVLFGTDQIAFVLSPGLHSPFVGLGVAVLFLGSRVVALILAPGLAVAGVVQILLAHVRQRDDRG